MKILTAIMVTAILASVAWFCLFKVSRQTWQVQQWSDVARPTQRMLDDIVAEFDRGDHEVAIQKLRALQQRWTQFMEGGATPELFQQQVTTIGVKTNAPVLRPKA